MSNRENKSLKYLNFVYGLWFDDRPRNSVRKKDYITNKKRHLDYFNQLLLSLYTIHRTSGLNPIVHIYIAKKDKYFIRKCQILQKKGIIHNIKLVDYFNIPWCTKINCFIAAINDLDKFLFLDVDVKIIKKLPIEKFDHFSLKFTSFGPVVQNGKEKDIPRLSCSTFRRLNMKGFSRRYIKKNKRRSKIARDYVRKVLKATSFRGEMCSGWVFVNKNSQENFDFDRYENLLLDCLFRLKREPPLYKFVQDQIIFSAALVRMGTDPNLVDFMFKPSLFFKARKSKYYRHSSNLESKFNYSFKEAKKWFEETG